MPSGHKLQLSDEQIKQMIIDYTINNYSARMLAKKNNIKCQKSVTQILNKNGIKTRTHKESLKLFEIQFSKEEELQIIQQYKNPEVGLSDLSKLTNHDPKTIKKLLQKYHVYDSFKFDKYLINKFNLIDTEEKAYWLGFLAADGSVSKKQLTLLLADKDKEHLLKFKNFIGVDYKIGKRQTTLNNKKFIGWSYSVSSTEFVKSLKKHNLYPNKSFTIEIPNTIPKLLIHHYIRGLFDGDGSIVNSNNRLLFSITSSKNMCEQVQDVLIKNCSLSKNKLKIFTSKKTQQKYSAISYCGNKQNKIIYNFLYKDAAIFLQRKYNIFKNKFTNDI